MSNFQIIVGTVYGSTIELADECQDFLIDQGHQCEWLETPELCDLDPSASILIMTASTGMGDIPDGLMPLYCDLLDEEPDLTHQRFALVGLGDSSYDYFNGAAKRLYEVLTNLNAQPLVEPLYVDANEDPEPAEPVMRWLASWIDQSKG
jgi:flavodoxin